METGSETGHEEPSDNEGMHLAGSKMQRQPVNSIKSSQHLNLKQQNERDQLVPIPSDRSGESSPSPAVTRSRSLVAQSKRQANEGRTRR